MTTKYYRTSEGWYIGAFSGTQAPEGGYEVPEPPALATQRWLDDAWVPPVWSRDPLLKIAKQGREIALNRLAGIAFAAREANDSATVAACLAARQALLDITALPGVLAATDDASLLLALVQGYTEIVAACPQNIVNAFSGLQS